MQKIEITVLNRESKLGQFSLARICAIRKNGETYKIR